MKNLWLSLALVVTLLVPLAYAQTADRPNLVIGVAGNPGGLDPATELSNVGARVVYNIYDTLIERNFLSDGQGGGNELVPMLAKSWERISDTVLELKLRDDVTFHNGDPLTSADVKFTFERILDADSPYIEARGYFATFASVETPDDVTVRIVTSQPDPLLEQRLASWAAQIVPQAYFEEVGFEGFAQNPVGTGPYKFAEMRADDRIVLDAFDDYWGETPPAAQVTFKVIPEVSARVTALVNGEAGIITNVPPDQVATINRYDDYETRSVVLANTHVLRYNASNPVLEDKRLRQALNLAIDRQLLSDALWGGEAVVPRGHQYPEYGDLYDPNRPLPEYNPEKARELVEASGYNGEPLIFRTSPNYYTNGLQAAQAIVEMWRNVGVNAEVQTADQPSLPVDDPASMVVNWSNSAIYPDFDGSLFRSWGPNGTPQAGGYWTPPAEFNELGNDACTTLDTKVRHDAYQQMLDVWEDEAPGTLLYQPLESYGVRKDIVWQPYSFYFMDLRADNLSFK